MYKSYDLFLAMGVGWAIYGIIIIITGRKNLGTSKIWATSILICFTIIILDHLIKPSFNSFKLNPLLELSRNTYYLIGPLIFFYSSSIVKNKKTKFVSIVIHFLPFIIWVIFTIILEDKLIGFRRFNSVGVMSALRVKGSFLSVILYGLFVMNMLFKHRRIVDEFYSRKSVLHSLSWLFLLTIFVVLLSFITFFYPFKNPLQLLTVFPVLFVFFFPLFAKDQGKSNNVKQDKYKKSSLDSSVVNETFRKLELMMNHKKLFLNPEVTIEDISNSLNVSKHNLSQVINRKSGSNFYTYINMYRVNAFKQAVKDKKYPDYTLVAIAFECGFSSSSSFYSIFKKFTGMPPKAYINSL